MDAAQHIKKRQTKGQSYKYDNATKLIRKTYKILNGNQPPRQTNKVPVKF